MTTVYKQAMELLVKVEAMVDFLSAKEPERMERRGMVAVASAASDLRTAFVIAEQSLSNPSVDAEGKSRADSHNTAKTAALKATPRTGTQRRQVLDFIATCDEEGATDEDIQVFTLMDYSSQGPRRRELVEGGWVEDSGLTRATLAGDQVTIWKITDEGRSRLDSEGFYD